MKRIIITLAGLLALAFVAPAGAAWKLPDGRIINAPRKIRIGARVLSSRAFQDPALLKSLGIKPWREQTFDREFYVGTDPEESEEAGEIVRYYVVQPRFTVDGLRLHLIDRVKKRARQALLATNRDVIVGEEVPVAVLDRRAAIRALALEKIQELNQAASSGETPYQTMIELYQAPFTAEEQEPDE